MKAERKKRGGTATYCSELVSTSNQRFPLRGIVISAISTSNISESVGWDSRSATITTQRKRNDSDTRRKKIRSGKTVRRRTRSHTNDRDSFSFDDFYRVVSLSSIATRANEENWRKKTEKKNKGEKHEFDKLLAAMFIYVRRKATLTPCRPYRLKIEHRLNDRRSSPTLNSVLWKFPRTGIYGGDEKFFFPLS